MSVARSAFVERFATYAATLAEEFVQDGALHESARNEKARLLRNGLAVVGFSYLEDFLRGRCAEVLASIGSAGVAFAELPDKVKTAATVGLLKAIQARVHLEPDEMAKIAFAQEQARFLASTAAAPYQLSEFTFGYKGSNVSSDEVADALRAFRTQAPWIAIASLASKVGLGSLSLEGAFENAAKRRHRAAHVAGAITPHGDLLAYINEAKAIAFGFDVLLSIGLVNIRRRSATYLAGGTLQASDARLVHLFFDKGRFKEKVYGASRSRATASSLAELEVAASRRAHADGEVLAYLNSAGQLENWIIPAAS